MLVLHRTKQSRSGLGHCCSRVVSASDSIGDEPQVACLRWHWWKYSRGLLVRALVMSLTWLACYSIGDISHVACLLRTRPGICSIYPVIAIGFLRLPLFTVIQARCCQTKQHSNRSHQTKHRYMHEMNGKGGKRAKKINRTTHVFIRIAKKNSATNKSFLPEYLHLKCVPRNPSSQP
jgi:hypothetical protein